MAEGENREAQERHPSIPSSSSSSSSSSASGEEELEDFSMEQISTLLLGSPQRISAVDSPHQDQDEDSDENSDDEFEFPSVIRDPAIAVHHPIYPVFGRSLISPPASSALDSPVRLPLRRLLIEERNSSVGSTSSSSSTAETADLEGLPPESYCLWAPGSVPQSPARYKSGSTGSLVKWKKISDLVLGRSQSDGKEKFVFLSAKGNAKEEKHRDKGKRTGKKGDKVTTELDTVTVHRILYGNKGGAANTASGPRKSFLPYKQDLVGLFASVNGVSRSHHPF